MNTLRIANRIHDFATWKQAFEKFDAPRRDKGVRTYRITRAADDPLHVFVDLDFDSATRAEAFRETLAPIWRTPQSREQQADHIEPVVLSVLSELHYPADPVGPARPTAAPIAPRP